MDRARVLERRAGASADGDDDPVRTPLVQVVEDSQLAVGVVVESPSTRL